MRIVIIEDEAIISLMYQSVLEEGGHAVVANSLRGTNAIDIILDQKPDAAIVDVRLQDNVSGIDVCREITASSDCQVLIITAYQDDSMVALARDAGASDVLCKPVSGERLLQAVMATSDRT